MKDNFLLKLSQSKIFYELSDEDAGKLIKGIFKYCEKNESELDGYLKIIFIPIKDEIDKNEEAYKKRCEKNRENGLKGGAPKGNKNASKQEITQNNRTVDKTTQNNPKQHDNNHISYITNHISYKNKNITYYSNNELNQIFIEYLELRKQLKAKNTERAINSLIKKLSNYDDETKILMIDKSIRNSWKDVYELKQDEIQNKTELKNKVEELTKGYQKNDDNLGELEELLKGF